MNHDITPMVEKLRKGNKPGVADEVVEHMNDLWGTPGPFERRFGRLIAQIPGLRNYVANSALAFRGLGRRLSQLQMILKLSSPKAAFVNELQPYSTLWPFVTTKEFAALVIESHRPSVLKVLADKGVLEGSSKLETTGLTGMHTVGHGLLPWNWFMRASEHNRAMGYLYGIKRGRREGMTEAQAHDYGLSWAEKVEFDNSQYNIQPILRSPQARVFGQFKSFVGKNLENVREVFTGSPGISKAERVGRIAK